MLSEFIKSCVKKVAKNEGFIDFEIETTAGSKHGDNFLGVMTAITVIGTRKLNGISKQESLYLICKAPPLSEIRRKKWNSKSVFDREIYIYTQLLPAFARFQKEKGLSEADSFLSFPKIYACEVSEIDDSYILIMENLKMQQFEMYPKDKAPTVDHLLIALQELAKFHAISFAMKDQRPNEFAEFKDLGDIAMDMVFDGSIGLFVEQQMDRLVKAIENPVQKKMVEKLRENYVTTLNKFLRGQSSKEFGVIRHGDFWMNNLMFQYADILQKHVKSVCLLDFQLSHYCTPVLDLLYNIFSSTDTKFRAQYYNRLIESYYCALSQMIRKLGSDPNQMYPYESFQMQLRQFGEYALIMAPMIISVRVAKETDVSNLDDYARLIAEGKEAHMLHEFTGDTQAEFSRLVNELVTDLLNYGYIKTN